MVETLTLVLIALAALGALASVWLTVSRRAQAATRADIEALPPRLEQMERGIERLERVLREEEERSRQAAALAARDLRVEVGKSMVDSFKSVSERLEQVHQGLGQMKDLAAGVGDLKRVLTNVKTRGTWGEYQLGNLLAEVMTEGQVAANVATRRGSAERVEFAIRLPGRGGPDDALWLPIDAKFPQEDYQRLVDAADRADAEGVEASAKALEVRIRQSAKDIATKYLDPPHTTDFALLFLPTEGLYAEVARRPGLFDALQRDHRVVVAGPTTLLALLNSLQMGFRTLAIERRSSEVWQVLGAFRTEFEKFAAVLEKAQDKVRLAGQALEVDVARRTRAIARKLREVESLPDEQALVILGSDAEEAESPEGREES